MLLLLMMICSQSWIIFGVGVKMVSGSQVFSSSDNPLHLTKYSVREVFKLNLLLITASAEGISFWHQQSGVLLLLFIVVVFRLLLSWQIVFKVGVLHSSPLLSSPGERGCWGTRARECTYSPFYNDSMISPKHSPSATKESESQREFRIIMGKQVLCLMSILFFVMVPFIITDILYSSTSTCKDSLIQATTLPFALSTWLIVKASLDSGYLLFILLTSLVIFGSQKYRVFLQIYSPCVLLLGLCRLVWAVMGAVGFWGRMFKNGQCTSGENVYLWVDLTVDFVTVVVNFLTVKSPAAGS